MKLKHKIKVDFKPNTPRSNQNTQNIEQTPLITTYFSNQKSRARCIAELAALDRLSFSQIASCRVIRAGLTSLKYDPPKERHEVQRLVMEYYQEVEDKVRKRLKDCKLRGKRFALTCDEWTCLKNKRMMNINLHSGSEPINLGLVPIEGSCTAEKAVELVEERLNQFEISVKRDIVAGTTDGCSTMEKFGRLIDCMHMMCYAHAYHLSVCDVLYSSDASYEQYDEEEDDSDDEEDEEDDNTSAEYRSLIHKVSWVI